MRSALRRIGAQGWFEFTAIARNGEQVLLNLIMPLIAIIVLAKTGLIDTADNQWGQLDTALTAGLGLAAMSSAFTSIAIATGFDRRAGFLRYLGTTPLARSGLIAGKALAVLILIGFQTVIMVGTALALGWDLNLRGLLIALVPLVVSSAAFTSWALLLAGTLRAEAVLALANIIWLLLVLTAGSVLVSSHLPAAVSEIANYLPSGALITALGTAVAYSTIATGPLAIVGGWLIVGLYAANRWFKWD